LDLKWGKDRVMYKIIYSDVYAGIYNLSDSSIDIAITSPPYWGQRDYGFEGQIGNEPKYIEYISKLVKIFNLLKEKMSEKGVFFLNVGDKYLSKYGKSPLGLIPYKLAYFMVKDGWILNDILIWYKPNHMPSSVKNRFTNSYEPIFVLSKNKDNYFYDFVKLNKDYSNILKINLQPTPYRHVAVFPENLVYKLLNMVNIPQYCTVLDMFAGSGTTLKVVKDLNESILYKNNINAIMIENNLEYIEIIKKRCNLNNKPTHYDFIFYDYPLLQEKNDIIFNNNIIKKEITTEKNGFIETAETKEQYYSLLLNFFDKEFKKKLELNATCFIGSKDFDIDLIYNTSNLNNNGWIIRNMLVIEENNRWYPSFMIIDDNKIENNVFNYKNLNITHKTSDDINWGKINFIGLKVKDNISKKKVKGVVIDIEEKYNNGLPKYLFVKWENGLITKEFVILSRKEINNNISFSYDEENKIIELKEKEDLFSSQIIENYNENIEFIFNQNLKNYNGKYRNEKRINWGASPGARASNEEIYFSKQRLYEVDQKIVATYLNYLLKNKKMPKKSLLLLFPSSYNHTIGHWFRKDFGGSIPLPEDWQILKNYFNINEHWTNYVCKTALTIQIVKKGEYKLPKDFIEKEIKDKLECLIK